MVDARLDDRETVLDVRRLTKDFGGVHAVDDLSFDVGTGEMLALIGPNGAGKTTGFNLLSGQLVASAGQVSFRGRNITGLPPRRIARLGIARTFQITATWASMTVAENVQLAIAARQRRLFAMWPRARELYRAEALTLLEQVGMQAQAERAAAVLAYGDLKRLELAIALAGNPELLLLDEPTAGMAPDARHELMALIASIVAERRLSVLFTEHDMDVVFGHADRVMVLNRGELIACGTVAAIRDDALVREVYLGGGRLVGNATVTDATHPEADGEAGQVHA
ncbi:MAG: ABC transporter ATP-binding protein [Gammaproteobacteria bacterium]|nr:MAG: ABC transporter ATP-binding protein [Gammaproteobacteria bacterium]